MVARAFRQPAFLGHTLVGIAVAYLGITSGGNVTSLIEILSSSGVMLLLFLVGLEMDVAEVRKMGLTALIIGFFQIGLSLLLFALVLYGFGVSLSGSIFLGLALSFSSTIIVVKLLSEKHDLTSLPGKMAVALLLIQDMAAIVALMFVGGRVSDGWLGLLVKVAILVFLTILMSRKVMPKILHRLAKSTDELILFSLAWCFLLASIIASPLVGLSLEIGGFLAGLALSGSFEHTQIAHKIKPIRDFFLTLFFVGLGLNLRFDRSILPLALVLSGVVIFAKPFIVWLLMRLMLYKQRVAFYTGLLFGQISEFSIILVALGERASLIPPSLASLVSFVGLFTMVISAYLIIDNEKVYALLRPVLRFYKDRNGAVAEEKEALSDHIVLFGCHRMGRSVLVHLKKQKNKVLIVDFDPEAVERLRKEGWNVIYADISDTEVYDQLNLSKASMVVSTVNDLKDNLLMLSEIKRRRLSLSVVVDAETNEDAQELYKAGATYVIFPHFVGGLHLADLVKRGVRQRDDFEKYRKYQQEIMAGAYDAHL